MNKFSRPLSTKILSLLPCLVLGMLFAFHIQGHSTTAAAASNGLFTMNLPVMNRAGPQTIEVCGDISANTTWSAPNDYIVTCQVRVNAGKTLTISPGTLITFDTTNLTPIKVAGNLVVSGAPGDEVRFTPADQTPTHGSFGQLRFDPGSTAQISYAVFEYFGGIVGDHAAINIDHADIGWSDTHGVSALDSTLNISDSTVHDNLLDGIRVIVDDVNVIPIIDSNIVSRNDTAIFLRFFDPFNGKFTVSGNSGAGNNINGVWIKGDLRTQTLQKNANLPYVFNTLTVPIGVSLTIDPGVVIKTERSFSENQSRVEVDGTMIVNGTSSEPVVFTSLNDDSYGGNTNGNSTSAVPQPGDWRELTVQATGLLNASYMIVRYAGYGDTGPVSQMQVLEGVANLDHIIVEHGLLNGIFAEDTSLVLTDSVISDHPGFGVKLFGNNAYIQPVITDNQFNDNGTYAFWLILNGGGMGSGEVSGNSGSGNGMVNGVYIEGSITDTISRWDTNPNFPYVVWTVIVDPRKKLTLEPGVVVKFTSPPDQCSPPSTCRGTGTFIVDGTLLAEGTSNAPIVFTSYWDDNYGGDTNGNFGGTSPLRGDWREMDVHTAGSASFDNAIFRYGGEQGGMMIRVRGAVDFSNGLITESGGNGIGGTGSLNLSFSSIQDNDDNGIQLNGVVANQLIEWNNIQNNGDYGLINFNGPNEVDAENNYWGHASGPSWDLLPCSNAPSGSGDLVGCAVDWSPFQTSPIANAPSVVLLKPYNVD